MKHQVLTTLMTTAIALITTATSGTSVVAASEPNPRSYCPSGEESIATQLTIAAETKDFHLNICKGQGEKQQLYYVSSAKKGNNYIFLPILRAKAGFYSAKNKQFTYSLDFNQKLLRVYKGKKLILQQNIYKIESF